MDHSPLTERADAIRDALLSLPVIVIALGIMALIVLPLGIVHVLGIALAGG